MKLPVPKAILFDWDDTIVDTGEIVRNAVNATLVAFGQAPWNEEEARRHLGPPARVLFTGLFGEDRWQEADRIYIDAYEKGLGRLRVHEGAEDILKLLRDRGIYMAVVSSKRGPRLTSEAAHLGFDRYFSVLVGAGDAEKDKPDPAAVRHALRDSGIEPGPQVYVIGDSHTDLVMAHNAGCTAVLIETKLPPADKIALHPPALRFATHREMLDFFAAQGG